MAEEGRRGRRLVLHHSDPNPFYLKRERTSVNLVETLEGVFVYI